MSDRTLFGARIRVGPLPDGVAFAAITPEQAAFVEHDGTIKIAKGNHVGRSHRAASVALAFWIYESLGFDRSPRRRHFPPKTLPIVTPEGAKVHVVTLRNGDTAHTRCGLTIEPAGQLIRAARGLEKPKLCRKCSPGDR